MGPAGEASRMRTRTLIGLLLLIPLADALFLVFVGAQIGWIETVLIVVLTGLIGILLVRAEGRNTIVRIQRKLARGDLPTNELMDGALLLIAGAFLLTPGLITDAIGLLLTLPPTRYPIRTALKKWVVTPYLDRQTDGFATGRIYTAGFPDDDPFEGGSPFEGDGPSENGPFGARDPYASDRDDEPTESDRDDGDVVDVDFEEIDERTDRS